MSDIKIKKMSVSIKKLSPSGQNEVRTRIKEITEKKEEKDVMAQMEGLSEKELRKLQKEVEKKEGKGKGRKKKDKNAPTGKRTGYIFFCKEIGPVLRERNPTLKPTEVMTNAGALWKQLSKKERILYELQAKEDVERFNKEKAVYEKKRGREQGDVEEVEEKNEQPKKTKTKMVIEDEDSSSSSSASSDSEDE